MSTTRNLFISPETHLCRSASSRLSLRPRCMLGYLLSFISAPLMALFTLYPLHPTLPCSSGSSSPLNVHVDIRVFDNSGSPVSFFTSRLKTINLFMRVYAAPFTRCICCWLSCKIICPGLLRRQSSLISHHFQDSFMCSSFVPPSLPVPPASDPLALLCSLDRQTHVCFFGGGMCVIVFACWK